MGPGSCVLLRDHRVARSRSCPGTTRPKLGPNPRDVGLAEQQSTKMFTSWSLGPADVPLHGRSDFADGIKNLEMGRRCWITEVGLMSSQVKVVPFISETGRWGTGSESERD